MRKLSLLVLVAVVMAGAIYAVQAYAQSQNDAAVVANSTTADQSTVQTAQCQRHADCPGTCDRCTARGADCPNYVDANNDGQCDHRGEGCSAEMRQNCQGHAEGGCCRHR